MVFDPFGDGESLLEQGKSLVKSAGDQAQKQAAGVIKTAAQQAAGSSNNTQQTSQQSAPQLSSDQKTQEFVKDLYGAGNKQPLDSAPSTSAGRQAKQAAGDMKTSQASPPQQQLPTVKQQLGLEKQDLTKKVSTVAGQLGLDNDDATKTASVAQQIGLSPLHVPKTPEEMAKMNKARQELQQMHDSTYFKPTFVEKPKIEEQRDEQEKNQEEQKKEMAKLQLVEQKKQELPIALQQARNKIEMPKGNAG